MMIEWRETAAVINFSLDLIVVSEQEDGTMEGQ